MKQEALEKLKKLNQFARNASTFWDRYMKTVSEPRCDKYEATFNGDDRFVAFRVKSLFFSTLTGYYGNSGCTTYTKFDEGLANHYFVVAVNRYAKEIFAEMARAAEQDAAKLADEAKREIAALQEAVALAEEAA